MECIYISDSDDDCVIIPNNLLVKDSSNDIDLNINVKTENITKADASLSEAASTSNGIVKTEHIFEVDFSSSETVSTSSYPSSYASSNYHRQIQSEQPVDDTDSTFHYAVNESVLAPWKLCQILAKNNMNDKITVNLLYSDNSETVKSVEVYHLAEHDAPHSQLKVGTRVIANLKYTNEPSSHDADFRAGIIANSADNTNNFRYLVFFDDGHAVYVPQGGIRCVCDSNQWKNVHSNARNFIKFYLEQYFEHRYPTATVVIGTHVKTELLGEWKKCVVVDVDCNLAKIRFEDSGETEWLFTGSPRLEPVWRILMKKIIKDINGVNGNIAEQIVVSDIESDDDDLSSQSDNEQFSRDPVFRVKKVNLERTVSPRKYIWHNCNKKCLFGRAENLDSYSPLARPIVCGWDRIVQYEKKRVQYITPCGRGLDTIQKLYEYLKETKCDLDIGCFTFEHSIDCFEKCVVNKELILQKDLTNGIEQLPIAVVNNYNKRKPKKFTYTNDCVPHDDIHLNTDANFLPCCDCTDDCADKFKCQCWQLTLAGQKYFKYYKKVPKTEFGYNFKRLSIEATTGIFECNSQCKCSQRKCLNRVVQYPISVKLEVFRTAKCGWGLRSVNDIPRGTFICNYAGDLITGEHSNRLAKKDGDMYMAQLDFIETSQDFKEDYERNVVVRNKRSDNGNHNSGECSSSTDYESNQRSSSSSRTDITDSNDDVDLVIPSKRVKNQSNSDLRIPKQYFPTIIPVEKEEAEENETRKLFGKEGSAYIIDGKRRGNIGRFINHSCEANLFLQHVFVDTHDIRFPRLSLFTKKNIKAGTELTWNYNYVIGSIPGRVLRCRCNSKKCKRRLL